MKTKILALLAGMMMAVSVSYAAPITGLAQGETDIGYMHYDMNSDTKTDSFYLENAVSDRFILGVENSGYAFPVGNVTMTDVYAQYKIDPNIRLIVGDRNYGGDTTPNESSSKFIYGVGANVNLAPKLDGYLSVTGSSIATEWQTGLAYKLNSQVAIQLGYKSYSEQGMQTMDGVGLGINYKF